MRLFKKTKQNILIFNVTISFCKLNASWATYTCPWHCLWPWSDGCHLVACDLGAVDVTLCTADESNYLCFYVRLSRNSRATKKRKMEQRVRNYKLDGFYEDKVTKLDSNFMVASGTDVPSATLETQSIMPMWQKDARALPTDAGDLLWSRRLSITLTKRHCIISTVNIRLVTQK